MEPPTWIEDCAAEVLEQVDTESIAVHRFLSDRCVSEDPAQDELFQFVFRSFYRLDSAGLSADFKNRFFELMSTVKSSGTTSVSEITRELGHFPNLKGQSSLQFSFATKMVATVCPHSAIYDSEVVVSFDFLRPSYNKPFDVRLEKYVAFHADLQALYDRIVAQDALKKTRTRFRSQFGYTETTLSEHRVLGFIFAAGARLREKKESATRYPAAARERFMRWT